MRQSLRCVGYALCVCFQEEDAIEGFPVVAAGEDEEEEEDYRAGDEQQR